MVQRRPWWRRRETRRIFGGYTFFAKLKAGLAKDARRSRILPHQRPSRQGDAVVRGDQSAVLQTAEREREKEFLLGESRLNFRKARKHYW